MDNKTLENRLEELKQLFGNYDYQIQQVEDEFSQTVEKLRTEALNKREQLIQQREQVRGAYTELYVLLHPEEKQRLQQSDEPEQEIDSVSTSSISMSDVNEENIKQPEENEKLVEEPHEEPTVDEYKLTQEELEKIEASMNITQNRVHEDVKTEQPEVKEEKQNDIPEYLTEEYNKMK